MEFDHELEAKENPLFAAVQELEFQNERLHVAVMSASLLYSDFKKANRLKNLKAIIMNIGEIYPEERAKVRSIFNLSKDVQSIAKPAKIRHGAKPKRLKKRTFESDCPDCPKVEITQTTSFKKTVVKSDSAEIVAPSVDTAKAKAVFVTVEDVLERFKDPKTGEVNVMAMKAFSQREGIVVHNQAKKPETIARTIVKHYEEIAAAAKADLSEEE